jgi:metallo-beta-lactamase family protein
VKVIDAFSAHADREELLSWIRGTAPHLKGVFVVHGEEAESLALAEGISELGVPQVSVPRHGETVSV